MSVDPTISINLCTEYVGALMHSERRICRNFFSVDGDQGIDLGSVFYGAIYYYY